MEYVTRQQYEALEATARNLAYKIRQLEQRGSSAFASQKCGCTTDDARAATESRNGELSAAERSEQKPSAATSHHLYLKDRQLKPSWSPAPNTCWDWDEAAGQWYCAPLLAGMKAGRQGGEGMGQSKSSASKAGGVPWEEGIQRAKELSAKGVEAAALSLAKEIERETAHLQRLRESKGYATGESSASKAGIIYTSVQEKDLAERELAAYLRGFQDAKKLLADVVPAGYTMVKQQDNFLWVNVYKHPADGSFETSEGYGTLNSADNGAASNRVARVRVWFSEDQYDE